jgi:hypothetical protein
MSLGTAIKVGEQALPFVEEAVMAIDELISLNRSKKENANILNTHIDMMVKEIEANEKWFKDKGLPVPKGGSGSFITAIKEAVARIINAHHDRKIKKLSETASSLEAYNDFLVAERGKVGSGKRRGKSRPRARARIEEIMSHRTGLSHETVQPDNVTMEGGGRYGKIRHMHVGAMRDTMAGHRIGRGSTISADMRADPDYFQQIR